MTRGIIILSALILIFTVGCTNSASREERQNLQEEVEHLQAENETLAEQLSSAHNETESGLEQIDNLSNENQALQQELADREQEYLDFSGASPTSRSFIDAMIQEDIEQLEHLTTTELNVYQGYFEQEIGGEVIEIPYDQLSTEPMQNNQGVISVHGYHFDGDNLVILYSRTVNGSKGYIHLELVEDAGEWKVNSVAFDT